MEGNNIPCGMRSSNDGDWSSLAISYYATLVIALFTSIDLAGVADFVYSSSSTVNLPSS